MCYCCGDSECNCQLNNPFGCLLAGIIVGMLLIILLSNCGAINVPRPERFIVGDGLSLSQQGDVMRGMRGDSPPPVVRGDPFVLSLKDPSSRLNPYA